MTPDKEKKLKQRQCKKINQQKTDKSVSKTVRDKITNNVYSKFTLNKHKDSFDFKNKSTKKNLISYIINVNLSLTNTLVNVTDIDGNPKIAFCLPLIFANKIGLPGLIATLLKK